jgi:hypothetical protein
MVPVVVGLIEGSAGIAGPDGTGKKDFDAEGIEAGIPCAKDIISAQQTISITAQMKKIIG